MIWIHCDYIFTKTSVQPGTFWQHLVKKMCSWTIPGQMWKVLTVTFFSTFSRHFLHSVNNLFTVQIIFYTGFYKESLKKCVENRSVKIFFPKSVWKILFSTLIGKFSKISVENRIFHTDFGKQIFTLLFSTHFLLQNTDLKPGWVPIDFLSCKGSHKKLAFGQFFKRAFAAEKINRN